MSSIMLHDLSWSTPHGRLVLADLVGSLGEGLTGLIGRNGVGKSTLLQLIAGELSPTAGTVVVDGTVGYLAQHHVVAPAQPISDVLGITAAHHALQRAAAGAATEEDFVLLADQWDVDDRARATLGSLGLPHGWDLDQPVGSLSGGELTRLRLSAVLLADPDVLLVDEPTADLDAQGRRAIIDLLRSRHRPTLVASHDRELLEVVDQLAELTAGRSSQHPAGRAPARLRLFGGNLTAWTAAVATEQASAERAVRDAQQQVRRQQRDLITAQTVIDRRLRTGRRATAEKRQPKVVMNARRREAEVSAANLRNGHREDLHRARATLTAAQEDVADDTTITIDLTATTVPTRRRVIRVSGLVLRHGLPVDLALTGPERVAITGRNGSGKSTLLHTLTGQIPPRAGQAEILVPFRLLPQSRDLLDPADTILDAVAAQAPEATPHQLRERLARFLLRGSLVDQPVGTLSGGERFRATLAALLLATPAPQLLILDEPANSLDLESIDALVQALQHYRGALLITSHDRRLLDDLELTRRIKLPESS